MDRNQRKELARTRLTNVLNRHGIALSRTLEQKISDAGPYNQRIDPHVLTDVRRSMQQEGLIQAQPGIDNSVWYHLSDTDPHKVAERYKAQAPDYKDFINHDLRLRIGQALEIAIYRSLLDHFGQRFFGRFRDLNMKSDNKLYSKEEPPSYVGGNSIENGGPLDFLVQDDNGLWAGIEAKNIREWLYPQQTDIMEIISKCLELDVVPVLIGRRIPYVTFRIFHTCGFIFHQTYNQLLPESDDELALRVRSKYSLGYHDIRTGNRPDARLTRFVSQNLPQQIKPARERFNDFKDLLSSYCFGQMQWDEFAARVRRREQGTNEDTDEEYDDFR